MIEVTEDAFVAKNHFQAEILPMFRKLGVGISIDDFGTGYSSLSALADITADEIKIDRSFITDIHKRPRNQGILRAMKSLSEALGMTVVAEGMDRPPRSSPISRLRPRSVTRRAIIFPDRSSWRSWKLATPALQRSARQRHKPLDATEPAEAYSRAGGYRR